MRAIAKRWSMHGSRPSAITASTAKIRSTAAKEVHLHENPLLSGNRNLVGGREEVEKEFLQRKADIEQVFFAPIRAYLDKPQSQPRFDLPRGLIATTTIITPKPQHVAQGSGRRLVL